MNKIHDVAQIRLAAENDFETFVRLVLPLRVLGHCHSEVMRWFQNEDTKKHKLLLFPRDHQKSFLAAAYVAWRITKYPAIRVLYISATSTLAVKQLHLIKSIITSDIYRRYWPEMINEDESKREKWTEREIAIDHPLRKAEMVRDATVFTAGLTTTVTGLHFDLHILDDVVVKDNAYTDEGRQKVAEQYSLLASVAGTNSEELVVGTRYHPNDLYGTMATLKYKRYEDGQYVGDEEVFDIWERPVEDVGDGTGQFLWPVQHRHDGKQFGFDVNILSQKEALYLDKLQFRAQYYNNPNDLSTSTIVPEYFQYYNPQFLYYSGGKWNFKGARLNVFASIDFAYSLAKRADFTCISVIGVDAYNNYYILDIDRFKTNKISDYYQHILKLHEKWKFHKIRAEVTAAQEIIVKDLKDNYIRKNGLLLSVEEYRPSRNEGTKQERVEAILQPRYANLQMWHYKGGNCQILEEELVLAAPPHDDVKDCVASCVDICTPPTMNRTFQPSNEYYHPRFGGIL